jgi:hypothetical protein
MWFDPESCQKSFYPPMFMVDELGTWKVGIANLFV